MPFLTATYLMFCFHRAEFPGIGRAVCALEMLQLRKSTAALDHRTVPMLSLDVDTSNGARLNRISAKMRSPDMATSPPILTRPGQ
jgi:hypothetical protein